MRKINKEKMLELLKIKIGDFDLAVPGRLREVYSKCGKKYCACQKDKNARHGPYILWDRKVNEKLTSKMVSKKLADQIKKWIDNRKKLEEMVQEILNISQSLASNIVDQERNSGNKKM